MQKTNEKNSGWKRLFASPWFLAFNLVVLGFAGWSYWREAAHGEEVGRQLADLERQADGLETKNREYEALIKKVGTRSFVERQARLSLGYQNPGEKEIFLTKGDGLTPVSSKNPGVGESELTNPQKWWRYFFSDD